ncbi:MAG: hypothetical protein E6Q68_07870 [Polynucleobacter sp.]|nr:MAG: hypothetical protein E6Q68_07870 [Polynucleobacter sp.]
MSQIQAKEQTIVVSKNVAGIFVFVTLTLISIVSYLGNMVWNQQMKGIEAVNKSLEQKIERLANNQAIMANNQNKMASYLRKIGIKVGIDEDMYLDILIGKHELSPGSEEPERDTTFVFVDAIPAKEITIKKPRLAFFLKQ